MDPLLGALLGDTLLGDGRVVGRYIVVRWALLGDGRVVGRCTVGRWAHCWAMHCWAMGALLGDGRVVGPKSLGCPLRQNQQSISDSPSDKNHVLSGDKTDQNFEARFLYFNCFSYQQKRITSN